MKLALLMAVGACLVCSGVQAVPPEETQAEFVRATLATADAVEHLAYLFEKLLLREHVIGPDDTEYQDLD